jgi:hypothetical protein
MRKRHFASAWILFAVLLASPLAALDSGATVKIVKKDGTSAGGELLAVKRTALVILPRESGGESLSIPVEEIKSVTIARKSHTGTGMLVGSMIGCGIGLYWGSQYQPEMNTWGGIFAALPAAVTGKVTRLFGGLAIGFILGAIIGSAEGGEKTYRLDGLSDRDQEKDLGRISQYAAVKGVR